MKAKILFILHIPPPVNGAAVVGQFIKESRLINESFDAHYINLTTSFQLQKIGKGSLSKILTILQLQFKIVKALTFEKYDLCYMTLTANGPGFYKDLLIVGILKLFGKNIIYHFHNKGVKENSNNAMNRMLYRFVFRGTKSIQLSPLLYYDIADYVKKENVTICSNGIPEIPKTPPTKSKKDKSKCTFLFLSNMMIEKGIFVLLDSCKILHDKGRDFECYFVGAWSDISETDFQAEIAKRNLSAKVFAVGPKYAADKQFYFEKSDVFIFPTFYHYESFPLVNLEAMGYGLPIISTYEGGIPDMIQDGVTGLLVPQRDSAKLAKKMKYLMKNPKKRIKMGKAGKARLHNLYTLGTFERNMKQVLKQAIDQESFQNQK